MRGPNMMLNHSKIADLLMPWQITDALARADWKVVTTFTKGRPKQIGTHAAAGLRIAQP